MRKCLRVLAVLTLVAASPIVFAEAPVNPARDTIHGVVAYLAPTEEAPEDAEGGAIIAYLPGVGKVIVFGGVDGLEGDGGYDLRVAVRKEGEDTQIQELDSFWMRDGCGWLIETLDGLGDFNVVQVTKGDTVYLTSWEGEGGWLKNFELNVD
ncbi:MAG: hypothetical protein PVJ27_02185 [Candidatus Brocadiaceae bacterium]|jgi:hypothetical protein